MSDSYKFLNIVVILLFINMFCNLIHSQHWKNYNTFFKVSAQVSCCIYPAASSIRALWQQNMQPLLQVLSTVQQGIFIINYGLW